MAARFGRDTWSLLVPDGWRAWHDDECATLVGPGEIGALQINTAFKDAEVLDADLGDFASNHRGAGAPPRPTQAGDFVGFEIAFRDRGRFWRHWYLRNGRQMLFVTYNCRPDSQGVEDGPVQDALASLTGGGCDVA